MWGDRSLQDGEARLGAGLGLGADRVGPSCSDGPPTGCAGRQLRDRPLLVFPEGTTTNGRYVLPFKTSAFRTDLPVLAVALE